MVDFDARVADAAPIVIVAAAPARDPAIAEREEFDAAMAANTAPALRLFLDRHPKSPWRAQAEKTLRSLSAPAEKP